MEYELEVMKWLWKL